MEGKEKRAALAALREQLGNRVVTGSEFLRVQEAQETVAESGLAALNQYFGGGLPKGQLTEIISERGSGGGGLVMAALLARARREQQYVMLLDVGSGFAPESFPPVDLEALLWVGCASPQEAVEALDVASRDENFACFLLDWRSCKAADWRSVRSSSWYRILGQLRERGAAAVIFAREKVTGATKHRLRVSLPVSCERLDEERVRLWEDLAFSAMQLEEWQGREQALRVG